MNKFMLQQIFCTKIGWLFVCLFLSLVFGILANWIYWCQTAMFISLIYPALLTLVTIVFAWIINPLRKLFNND